MSRTAPMCRSADWQSAVSPTGSRQTVRAPAGCQPATGRLPVCATRAGLCPPFPNCGQDVGHDFGLWLRANVSLAVETDTDRAGFHVAAADDQHGVDLGLFGVGDLRS